MEGGDRYVPSVVPAQSSTSLWETHAQQFFSFIPSFFVLSPYVEKVYGMLREKGTLSLLLHERQTREKGKEEDKVLGGRRGRTRASEEEREKEI